MQGTLFGFTEAQIAGFGVGFGLGAFMLYMLFIIDHHRETVEDLNVSVRQCLGHQEG
jgi:hypothetical protein